MVTQAFRQQRMAAALAAAAVQLVFGYALLTGLSVPLPNALRQALTLIYISPPPPPLPPPVRKPVPPVISRATAGRSAPTAPAAPATPPLVAPPLVLPEFAVTPIDVAASGALDAGVSDGGAGGAGSGTGSGSEGRGAGNGDADIAAPPRWLSGRIKASDYPREASAARTEGSLSTEFTVGVDGRVTDCRVAVSSGSAVLDAATCRLIRERYHYAPARDTQGRAVADIVLRDHFWSIQR